MSHLQLKERQETGDGCFSLRTDLGATYPPGAIPMPDESSKRSLSPLTTAGVGEGAKVAGTEEGM